MACSAWRNIWRPRRYWAISHDKHDDANKEPTVTIAQTVEPPQEEAAITRLADLETPCLILDADRMDRNIANSQVCLAAK